MQINCKLVSFALLEKTTNIAGSYYFPTGLRLFSKFLRCAFITMIICPAGDANQLKNIKLLFSRRPRYYKSDTAILQIGLPWVAWPNTWSGAPVWLTHDHGLLCGLCAVFPRIWVTVFTLSWAGSIFHCDCLFWCDSRYEWQCSSGQGLLCWVCSLLSYYKDVIVRSKLNRKSVRTETELLCVRNLSLRNPRWPVCREKHLWTAVPGLFSLEVIIKWA